MFARMPWFLIHWHVFESDAVDKPLRPLANRFCGCSVWALAPFCVVFGALLFASLFPLAKRKSGWGICGWSCLVVFCGFCVLFYSICLLKMDMLCPLYKRLSDSLCSCKDRAFSATSAILEEKKKQGRKKCSKHGCDGETSTVASGLGHAQREKVCVDIHVQAAGSQICLQNICGQQRNSPMADPIFGSKYGPQNRVQNWITFSFLLLSLCLGPFLGSRFGLDPKVGPAIGKFCCCPQMFCKQICDALA